MRATSERAATAVLVMLGALALARALGAMLPGTSFWGINLMRFAPAGPSWALWAVGALVLVPAVAGRLEGVLPAAVRTGEPGARAATLWACAAGALALALPDRTLFVGDTILRQNALHAPPNFAALNPQALLPDRWLHDDLPRAFASLAHLDVITVTRIMGALEAAALAVLGVHASRILGLRGTRAGAVACLLLFTGTFGLFTGYSKSLSELSLAALATGVFGLEFLRTGRGLGRLGLSCALGVALHRLGLGLLPAFGFAVIARPRDAAALEGRARLGFALGVLAPVVSLALLGPALLRIMKEFDPQNFATAAGRVSGGTLAAALAPHRLLDAPNMLLWVAPLAPLLVVAAALPFTRETRRQALFLLALVLPWLAVLLLFRPPIGLVRNWDVFAPLGSVLALGCAWGIARIPAAGGVSRALGLAVALNAFAPAVVFLLHQSDVTLGLARVEALLSEKPQRDDLERASGWDFLGERYADLGRLDDAAHAFANAAELTPSPRILRQWATLEEMRGRPEQARDVLRQLVRRKPDEPRAWSDLVRLSTLLGDTATARRDAEEALRLMPGAPGPRRFLDWLARAPRAGGGPAQR